MNTKRDPIAEKTKLKLWTRSAGRCAYRGCGKELWRDDLSLRDLNAAHIAHIHGVKPKAARYSPTMRSTAVNHFDNLMLMCYTHHRMIDHEEVKTHPAELLREMKNEHERRIELVSGFKDKDKTEVVRYGKAIGTGSPVISFVDVWKALGGKRYPASSPGMEIRMKNDRPSILDGAFWKSESDHLRSAIDTELKPKIRRGEIQHLSVFAIAQQPLLVFLGHLLSAMVPIDIYQRQKRTDTWGWDPVRRKNFEFIVRKPQHFIGDPVLVLSLSAEITRDRVSPVVPREHSVWEIISPEPNTDFLRHRYILEQFCDKLRTLLNDIKVAHGHHSTLHVIPAAPISACIELGRQHTATADLPMIIYNEDPAVRKFRPSAHDRIGGTLGLPGGRIAK